MPEDNPTNNRFEKGLTLDEIEFRSGAIVEMAGLETDNEGYVIQDNERLTDGFNVPIKEETVGGVISLEKAGLHLNEEGVVVDEDGTEVWLLSNEERRDLFVPFTHEKYGPSALVREDYASKEAIVNLVEKSDLFL